MAAALGATRADVLAALRIVLPTADAALMISLASLGHADPTALAKQLKAEAGSLTLGQRKRLELGLRSLPPNILLQAEPAPLPLRLAWAWQERSLQQIPAAMPDHGWLLRDSAGAEQQRASDAAYIVAGGALLSHHCFALRGLDGGHSGFVGCAELLIVRAPPPLVVDASPCRVCWVEEHGDEWLDPAVAAMAAAAAVTSGDTSAALSLPVGSLLTHPCACRGSGGSVHEGCLVGFLAATTERCVGMTLQELVCPTCKQPYVGRASHLLAGCAAAVRAARASMDERRSEQAAEAAEHEVAGAAEVAEEAALMAAEGRVNEATALWKAGCFGAALERFHQICASLQTMPPPRDAMRALRKALLQHSTEHNLGLILKEHGELSAAQPLVASALAGFEVTLGAEHPKTLHAMHSVGLLAAAHGSHEQAAACFRSALEGRRAALGPRAHDTLRSAIACGTALLELRRFVEADELLLDAEAGCHRALGAESPLALHASHARALALGELPGRRAEAVTILRRVHGARVCLLGETHRDALAAASALGELLGR